MEELLRKHDIPNPIKGSDIMKILHISTGAELRSQIRDLRRKGCPIGSTKQGYFWASSPSELGDTIKQLNSRAFDLIKTVKALKRSFRPRGIFGLQIPFDFADGRKSQKYRSYNEAQSQ